MDDPIAIINGKNNIYFLNVMNPYLMGVTRGSGGGGNNLRYLMDNPFVENLV